jgi:hypothetical protein
MWRLDKAEIHNFYFHNSSVGLVSQTSLIRFPNHTIVEPSFNNNFSVKSHTETAQLLAITKSLIRCKSLVHTVGPSGNRLSLQNETLSVHLYVQFSYFPIESSNCLLCKVISTLAFALQIILNQDSRG